MHRINKYDNTFLSSPPPFFLFLFFSTTTARIIIDLWDPIDNGLHRFSRVLSPFIFHLVTSGSCPSKRIIDLNISLPPPPSSSRNPRVRMEMHERFTGNESYAFRMENFRVFRSPRVSGWDIKISTARATSPWIFALSWICNVDWTELIPESLEIATPGFKKVSRSFNFICSTFKFPVGLDSPSSFHICDTSTWRRYL